MREIVYKICPRDDWEQAVRAGAYEGAPVDTQDGFIHLSAAHQVAETAARHFAGEDNLLLVSIDARQLGEALKWEPSRGGDLFPHLYGTLRPDAVRAVEPLPLGRDGVHVFPEGVRA